MALQAETPRFNRYVDRLVSAMHLNVHTDDLGDGHPEREAQITAGPPVGNMVWVTANGKARGVSISVEPWGDWEEHPEDAEKAPIVHNPTHADACDENLYGPGNCNLGCEVA